MTTIPMLKDSDIRRLLPHLAMAKEFVFREKYKGVFCSNNDALTREVIIPLFQELLAWALNDPRLKMRVVNGGFVSLTTEETEDPEWFSLAKLVEKTKTNKG